MKELQVRIIME